ncbi:MAG TPA: hypothetical protein VFQ68_45650 [Streptosporangiaceae bacterium]|nr:hypothetical protein [Streptosporangiaceae bacterium]
MTEPPDFERLFRSTARTAAHLEMRDDYGGSSPAFAAWREHRPYDRAAPMRPGTRWSAASPGAGPRSAAPGSSASPPAITSDSSTR